MGAPKPPKAPVKPRRVDWDAVKRDFRTSKFTQTELSIKHKLDQATLSRKIKRDRELDPASWPEDLSAAVRQATNARLMEEMVKTEISEGQEQVKNSVKIAAEMGAQIILGHRTWLKDLATDALAARTKLRVLAKSAADIKEAHTVIQGIEASSRTFKTVIEAQRKAFGLDDPEKPSEDIRDMSDAELLAEIEAIRARRA
jgi:sugar phosphate isomerase/epimerase